LLLTELLIGTGRPKSIRDFRLDMPGYDATWTFLLKIQLNLDALADFRLDMPGYDATWTFLFKIQLNLDALAGPSGCDPQSGLFSVGPLAPQRQLGFS
jgi:hypothetical protein